MNLTGPHVVTGRRKLLKATLVGVSGAFQRVQYQGAGAATLILSATAQARRLFSAAGSAALTFSASATTQPVNEAASGFAALLTGASAIAITRRQAAGAAMLALAGSAAAQAQRSGAGSAKLQTGATGAASVVPGTPFLADSDTYWWDFDFAGNVLDSVGHNTLAIARERLRGEIEPWQPTKARQPLKITGGIEFNQSTNRGLVIDLPSLTNGKNGWYLAGVIQPTTANSQIMSIARNSSSAMSRMDMLVNGSRNVGFRAAPGDGSSPAYVLYTSQITLGQVYAFEFLWDFDADTAIAWLNGVQQTPALGPVGAPWTNFPATNPSDIRIGNTIADNLSFNGTIRQLIFRDGVPSPEQRASISAYNQSRAA